MKGIMRRLCVALAALLALAAPALALSDAEHRQFMKDPAFAAADKKLNEAWAAAQKSLPKAKFEALEKDQRAWIDERAKLIMEGGDSKEDAYAEATEHRAAELSFMAQRYERAARIGTRKLSVTLVNKTDAKVFVALARAAMYQDVDESHDISKGWWGVEPGETKTIQPWDYSVHYAYGYYATSRGGQLVWGASDVFKALPGESGYPIHPTKAFESHRDRPISSGKQVLFRDLHPEDAEGEEEWKMAPVVFQEDNVLGAEDEDEDEDDYE